MAPLPFSPGVKCKFIINSILKITTTIRLTNTWHKQGDPKYLCIKPWNFLPEEQINQVLGSYEAWEQIHWVLEYTTLFQFSMNSTGWIKKTCHIILRVTKNYNDSPISSRTYQQFSVQLGHIIQSQFYLHKSRCKWKLNT